MNLKDKIVTWWLEGLFQPGNNLRKKVFYFLLRRWEQKEKTMLDNIRQKLSGVKTYVVGGAAILGSLAAWLNGTMDLQTFVQATITSVLAMTVRAGVQKAEEAAK